MSLFKRGSVWWSYFYFDGVRHQYSTGTSNRKQAKTIEGKLKDDVNRQRFQIVQTDPDLRFGELAARFMASGSNTENVSGRRDVCGYLRGLLQTRACRPERCS